MQENTDKTQSGNGSSQQVGYRHPPEATRFKKGQSGNPEGRRKGALNVSTVFAQALSEKVVVNEKGQRKKITKLQAAIKQLVNKAATGDHRAILQVVSLSREAETREGQALPRSATLSESDQKVMDGILKQIRTATDSEGDSNDNSYS